MRRSLRVIKGVEMSIFGAAGVLLLAFGIWKGAWVGIVIGLACIGVDVLINWAERPAKRP